MQLPTLLYSAVYLAVILISWFGDCGFDRQIQCTPMLLIITCVINVMNHCTLNIAQPNVRQFALCFNLPNLMFAKYTVYMISNQTPHITYRSHGHTMVAS